MFGQQFGARLVRKPPTWVICALAFAPSFAAADTEAAKPTPTPDDIPAVKVGATIFSDFTHTSAPSGRDADGNPIRSSAFDVSRAYVTVSGGISRLVSFRLTADVKRLASPTPTTATSLDGSESFRLKYAYGQIGLDRVLPKGSWVRIGAQQTPLVDFEEAVYGYRFQGTQMVERDGFLSSSDFGISTRVVLPKEYGDIHVGVYNGESYAKGEVNDQKALEVRATLRPLPSHQVLKGLRLTFFYDADRYMKAAPRNRLVANAIFEHRFLVAGADLIKAADQTSGHTAEVESSAYSLWLRPRTKFGLEGLLRYDSFKPNDLVDARRNRSILGASYWFKTPAPVSAALLADYERVTYAVSLGKPREGRLALHCLFAF